MGWSVLKAYLIVLLILFLLKIRKVISVSVVDQIICYLLMKMTILFVNLAKIKNVIYWKISKMSVKFAKINFIWILMIKNVIIILIFWIAKFILKTKKTSAKIATIFPLIFRFIIFVLKQMKFKIVFTTMTMDAQNVLKDMSWYKTSLK